MMIPGNVRTDLVDRQSVVIKTLIEAGNALVEAVVRDARAHGGISGFTGARLADMRDILAQARDIESDG